MCIYTRTYTYVYIYTCERASRLSFLLEGSAGPKCFLPRRQSPSDCPPDRPPTPWPPACLSARLPAPENCMHQAQRRRLLLLEQQLTTCQA